MTSKENIIVLLSGGLDSAVLLASLVDGGHNPICVTFDYRQRHWREMDAAEQIAMYYDSPWKLVSLVSNLIAAMPSALTTMAEEECLLTNPNVVVPGRNTVFLTTAGLIALMLNVRRVAFAVNKGDWESFPDCRPDFVDAVRYLYATFDKTQISLLTPFLHMTKAEVLQTGLILNAPLHLTWSCYEGRAKACGLCLACRSRLDAFRTLGAEDFIEYESL